MWDLWARVRIKEWEARESPSDQLFDTVIRFLIEMTASDPRDRFVAYPGDRNHCEAKVPGTNVYVEVYVVDDVRQIEILSISSG